MPLPLFFRTTGRTMPSTARPQEGVGLDHSPSITRRLSIRRRRKEARSSAKASMESGSEVSLVLDDHTKRQRRE